MSTGEKSLVLLTLIFCFYKMWIGQFITIYEHKEFVYRLNEIYTKHLGSSLKRVSPHEEIPTIVISVSNHGNENLATMPNSTIPELFHSCVPTEGTRMNKPCFLLFRSSLSTKGESHANS